MTDADIRYAARALSNIEYQEREAKDHERRAQIHRDEAAKVRAELEDIKAGRKTVNQYGQVVEVK